MIRYACEPTALEKAIDAVAPRWRARAQDYTSQLYTLGKFEKGSLDWGDVKAAFMDVQHDKCIFCERKYETPQHGKIELDIEHFRPKNAVTLWPSTSATKTYDFPFGPVGSGYYWLAYDHRNYAVSCKICNSTCKSNYFPIAGIRGADQETLDELASEEPYLCYPLGSGDKDPEELVTFNATVAIPAAPGGHDRRRGQVIIDLFELNKRDELHGQRAAMISLFGMALRLKHAGIATPKELKIIDLMDAPFIPHAGCVRAFKRVYDRAPDEAMRIYDACLEIVLDQSIPTL
ncbi:hypothetical protein [Agrobacterium radiobacter]|uniref:hypothetical protein n=1 Tax=Agrobacterium radiobacter TaxID=362 RepID=UPI003F87F712